MGVSNARNKGIEMSRGKFIVLQDADDISLPSRFLTLLQNFICDRIGLVHSDIMLMDTNKKPLKLILNRNIDKKYALRYFFKIGSPMAGATVMFRRKVFDGGLRYDCNLKIGEDNHLLCKVTNVWDSVHVPEVLYLYRKHNTNSSKKIDYSNNDTSHLRMILNEYSLPELVPELEWTAEEKYFDNLCRAHSIISLYLYRRLARNEAVEQLEIVADLINHNKIQNNDTIIFANAIKKMMIHLYNEAIQLLEECTIRDHIIENYSGECYGYIGDSDNAIKHILRSLSLMNDYIDALDNLKSIGGSLTGAIEIGDYTWAKFRSQ